MSEYWQAQMLFEYIYFGIHSKLYYLLHFVKHVLTYQSCHYSL